MPRIHSSIWRWLLAISVGIAGTVQFHLAQFTSRFDTFFGDRGDPRGVVFFCEHWYQAFLGKTNLLSPGIFYPTKGTLAYTDLLLGFAVPYSIVRALGFDMFTSVEIVVIVLNFLNYLACFILLNRILRFGLVPSAAGALFFAFNSPKFFQLTHLQLQYVLFLPLIFILVILTAQQSAKLTQKRALLLLSSSALLLNLQLLTSFYHAWFFVFWVFLFLALALVFKESRTFLFDFAKRYWRAIVGSFAVFLFSLIPFLGVYFPTLRIGNWYSYANVSEMIPAWWSMLSMGDGNYLWGWLSAAVRPHPLPTAWNELHVGVGLIPSLAWIALTIYALRVVLTKAPTSARKSGNHLPAEQTWRVFLAVMVLATSLFFILGFKYGNTSPWFFVYNFFPGAAAIRALSRYVIFLALPMAIGFAFILDHAMKGIAEEKSRHTRTLWIVAVVCLAVFGVVEQFGVFKFGGTGFSKRTEWAYLKALAAKLPRECKAFYIAPGRRPTHAAIEYQDDGMMISILSGIPTLNGASSQFPPNWSMYVVTDPGYEGHVKNWITSQGIEGNVCRLEIGSQWEAFTDQSANPITDPTFFVGQQYRDLLNREPTSEEANAGVEQIKNCNPPDSSCDRSELALKILHSTQYYDRGSFVVGLYAVGLGRMPRFEEFTSSMQRLADYLKSDNKEIGTDKFISDFMKNPEFADRYERLSDQDFINALFKNFELSSGTTIHTWDFGRPRNNRREMLRRLVESEQVARQLSNRVFVALQYFAYLRRDPDPPGFDRWLETLNATGDYRLVSSGFVYSLEYQERFGVAAQGN